MVMVCFSVIIERKPAEARVAVMTLLDSGAASKDTRLKLPGLSKWEYRCRGGR